MNLKLWAACAALSAAALQVEARQSPQQSPHLPDPSDPSVPVPATVYESVLSRHGPVVNSDRTPDKNWRPAIDAVAGPTDHAGHHPAAPAREAPPKASAEAPKEQHKHH